MHVGEDSIVHSAEVRSRCMRYNKRGSYAISVKASSVH